LFSSFISLFRSANHDHGGEAFLIAAVFPRALAIPEFPQTSFPDDLLHGGLMLLGQASHFQKTCAISNLTAIRPCQHLPALPVF
jgi:hypothetical protein